MEEHKEPTHTEMMRELREQIGRLVTWRVFALCLTALGAALAFHWREPMHWGAAEKAVVGETNRAVMQEMQRSIQALSSGISGLSNAVQENEAETAELRGYIRAKSGDSVQNESSEMDARGG